MTIPQYAIRFESMPWQSPMEGVRHKVVDQDGVRLRLVEYSAAMPAHWCEKGHYGYLLEGEMEVEYPSGKIMYKPGDGLYMPAGADHKHRGRVLTERALAFFIELL